MSPDRDTLKPLDHWIDQNSDFELIHRNRGKPKGRVFMSNHLPWIRGYKNSSMELYGFLPDIHVPVLADVVRSVRWPLPYKSTIVAPIGNTIGNDYNISGYLCVDSRSSGVFSQRYDVDIVIGIAQCMHRAIREYCVLATGDRKEAPHEEGR